MTWCLNITCAEIGAVSGLLDLPFRTIILSVTLAERERVTVIRSLLDRAGIVQHGDDVQCICGEPLAVNTPPQVAS